MVTDESILAHAALLVIDFQKDFLEPNGRWPVEQSDAPKIIAVVNRLIEALPKQGAEVVYIANEFRRWQFITRRSVNGAATRGQPGVELDSRLSVINRNYFSKRECNAFSNRKLRAFLRDRGINHLILTGVYASECIASTAEAGLQRGYRVTVISDAIADSDLGEKDKAIVTVRSAGAVVTSSSELLKA